MRKKISEFDCSDVGKYYRLDRSTSTVKVDLIQILKVNESNFTFKVLEYGGGSGNFKPFAICQWGKYYSDEYEEVCIMEINAKKAF